MAQKQIRGNTQIMDLTIDNAKLIDATLALSKLAEGDKVILSDWTRKMAAALDMDSNKVINVATPTAAGDAANKGYVDSAISGLSAWVELAWDFDASAWTFPSGSLQGNMFIVTVAGTIDNVLYSVWDNIIAKVDSASTTDSTDWIHIDNSEASDILRDADVSTNTDLTVDWTKLTDRTTIKAAIDAAVGWLWNEVWWEILTVTNNSPTVSALANSPTAWTVRVFLNGLRMRAGTGNDFTISGDQITFEYNLHNNDTVDVDYTY